MKRWYLFYSDYENRNKLQQPVEILTYPDAFSYVPWGHHIAIISKCTSIEEAMFYIKRIINEGLSRSALQNYMKADLYHTSGAAITNFKEILPATQGKLAQEITKDTYDLGFIR